MVNFVESGARKVAGFQPKWLCGILKDMKNLKKDFPFFANNPDVVYCDNAATTHKPQVVIDRIAHFYAHENAPVHRGLYQLAEQATTNYEGVREQVREFIGAQDASEMIFMPNATAGINLVAHAWAMHNLKSGDEIVLTELEHHANIVPWLLVAQKTGAVIRYIPITADGDLDYSNLDKLITPKTKLVAVTAISNVTGAHTDLELLTEAAHAVGAAILVDACQAVMRKKFDVRHQKFDFLVFSGHKTLGPAGIGVLFANRKFHAQMTPFQGGGGAVLGVTPDSVTWRGVPYCFELGTPAVADILGLGAALSYIQHNLNLEDVQKHEAALCTELIKGLQKLPRVKIIGPVAALATSGHMITFVVDGMHAFDIATYLDTQGIAVRAGHHCAQPLHTKLGVEASVRISFCFYNTHEDVAKILQALAKLF